MSLDSNLLPSLLATLLGTVIAIRWLIDRASGLGLLDRPGGRKSHTEPTPLVGGLGMGFGLLVIWLLVPQLRPDPWIIGGFLALLILGWIDDYSALPPLPKFGIELMVVAASVQASGLGLDHLGMLLPGVVVDPGWLAWPIAVFGVLSVLNALNMIDGIDGLSGSVACAGFAMLAAAAYLAGDAPLMQLALLPCAALAGFLVYNLRVPGRAAARVFMGDAGSLSIGFLLGIYAIQICQNTSVPAITTVWAVALPLLDGLTVIQGRAARGDEIMQPGSDHFHHLLRAWGLGVGVTGAIEASLAVFLGVSGILIWQSGADDWVSLLALLILALLFRFACDQSWRLLRQRPGDDPLSEQNVASNVEDRDRPLTIGLSADGHSRSEAKPGRPPIDRGPGR